MSTRTIKTNDPVSFGARVQLLLDLHLVDAEIGRLEELLHDARLKSKAIIKALEEGN